MPSFDNQKNVNTQQTIFEGEGGGGMHEAILRKVLNKLSMLSKNYTLKQNLMIIKHMVSKNKTFHWALNIEFL